MKKITLHQPHAHLGIYLAAGYVLFIIYASLSPFSGWREQGMAFSEVLSAPLLRQFTWFDASVNVLAYLPFGLLLGLTLRQYMGVGACVIFTALDGAALSAAMEYAQMYLPARNSSNLDLLTNTSGALLGAVLAISIAPRAWFALHLRYWRLRLFHEGGQMDFGLALVLLWMFAQVNPSLPMLGNVFISRAAREPFMPEQADPFNWVGCLTVALNLLMLGMLLLLLLRKRRHAVNALLLVLSAVAIAKFLAAAMLLKSWALLLWLNSEALLGMMVGLLLLILAIQFSRESTIRIAAVTALSYLAVANWLVERGRPSMAMPLYQWNYGHLLNYNGLSQSIALVLPFLMLAYLWNIRRGGKSGGV